MPLSPRTPGRDDIAAVVSFLPLFEQAGAGTPGPGFGQWSRDRDGKTVISYSDDAVEFVRLLEERGWVSPGYRPGDTRTVLRCWHRPELVASADAATLHLLLSDLVRTERICEGHLLEAFNRGYLTAILRRLKVLHGKV